MLGAAVFAGPAEAATTVGVGAEVAVVEPALFVAVTLTSSAEATSALWAVYVEDVAPEIEAQPLEQRSHWYAKPVGLPDQLPVEAVTVCPACANPEIVGGEESAGGETVVPPTGWLRTAAGTDPTPLPTEKESLIV